MLLVWSRARVFAKINGFSLYLSRWWSFHWGAWIRREKHKRLYIGYFKETPLIDRFFIRILSFLNPVVYNHPIVKIDNFDAKGNSIYCFNTVVLENDLFGSLREHRSFVVNEIHDLLNPRLLIKLNAYEPPVISVHIRRGDFKLGNPITQLSFFTDSITQIRKTIGLDWPVTVFTDAELSELDDILCLSNVIVTESKPDILDILLMSKSKVIILSRSSTFSYWAAFLSNAFVIMSANDWQKEIRGGSEFPEFRFDIEEPEIMNKLDSALKNFFN